MVKGRLAAKRKGPLARLRNATLPKATQIHLDKVDFDKVKAAAERLNAYGKQASDIAAAVEKTHKKNG